MNVLVAGGAGMIGSHLCDALVQQGDVVWCVDNLATGRRGHVDHLQAHPRFHFVRWDIAARDGPPPEIRQELGALDRLYHLASPASPEDFVPLNLEILSVNAFGTWHLLELTQDCGARFLYASTSEVYGDPLVHPQPEDYWGNVDPIGLRSCYDEGKRFGEALTMAYWRRHGLDARIVRIFNTYGPRMRINDGRVVPAFVTAALRGEPLPLHGTGEQTRSFCYVTDLVAGIVAAMEAAPEVGNGEVFNLGNPDEWKIADFARVVVEVVAEETGFHAPIAHTPLDEAGPVRRGDPARRCPDISKARRRLGWEPKVSVRQGLPETVRWFRTTLTAAEAEPTVSVPTQ